MKKTCSHCKIEKEIHQFYKATGKKDGHGTTCKCCSKEKSKEWNQNNREKFNKNARTYRQKHIEYIREYDRHRHGTNPGFKLKSDLVAAIEEPKRLEEIRKQKYQEVRDRENKQAKERGLLPENRKRRNEWERNRLKNDPEYKMRQMLRKRLANVLKREGIKKCTKTMDLLGCDIDFFMGWIEMHFQKGMRWDLHGKGKGKWNLDHWRPCSSFDMTNLEQQKECFRWTNIFPAWSTDNSVKNDSIPEPKDWQI